MKAHDILAVPGKPWISKKNLIGIEFNYFDNAFSILFNFERRQLSWRWQWDNAHEEDARRQKQSRDAAIDYLKEKFNQSVEV